MIYHRIYQPIYWKRYSSVNAVPPFHFRDISELFSLWSSLNLFDEAIYIVYNANQPTGKYEREINITYPSVRFFSVYTEPN